MQKNNYQDVECLNPRTVNGITDEERQNIIIFLLGAVYCWCNIKPEEWFSARDLVGGLNRDWTRTPLQALYLKHINAGCDEDEAFENAGKDVGWLLQTALLSKHSGRVFNSRPGWTREYLFLCDLVTSEKEE